MRYSKKSLLMRLMYRIGRDSLGRLSNVEMKEMRAEFSAMPWMELNYQYHVQVELEATA